MPPTPQVTYEPPHRWSCPSSDLWTTYLQPQNSKEAEAMQPWITHQPNSSKPTMAKWRWWPANSMYHIINPQEGAHLKYHLSDQILMEEFCSINWILCCFFCQLFPQAPINHRSCYKCLWYDFTHLLFTVPLPPSSGYSSEGLCVGSISDTNHSKPPGKSGRRVIKCSLSISTWSPCASGGLCCATL